MLNRFESSFRGYDDSELFYQVWMPDKPRGTILITHGLAEHSDCYHPFAKRMAEDNWAIYAWDLRGHGRSAGKRGFALNVGEFEKDLFRFYDVVNAATAGKNTPVILFGHSMGGLITLRAVLEYGPLNFAGLVLSSPALGLAVEVPKIKDQLARLTVKWLPTLTLYNELKFEDLSRDEDVVRSYYNDNLRHDKISPGIYLSMVESFPQIMAGAENIKMPTIMIVAGKDRIVSPEASQAFYKALGSSKKELHVFGDSYHEVFNDLDRELAFSDLKKFISGLEASK